MVGTYFDTATMYYRAFFAVPESITAPDGTPSGAVRGFLDMATTLLTQFPADNVVFAWNDDWRPAWRVALIPQYKAHRLDEDSVADQSVEVIPDALPLQIDAIAAILDAIGLSRIGHVGHEADDILGALVATCGGPARVVTGDRDLFQLVDDSKDIAVVSITKGVKNLEVVTDDWLTTKYGIRGSQYADFSTMRGDASDGLPGIAGVGEKTAATLIGQYGTLDGVLDAANDPTSAMKAGVRDKVLAAAEYLDETIPGELLREPKAADRKRLEGLPALLVRLKLDHPPLARIPVSMQRHRKRPAGGAQYRQSAAA